MTRRRPAIQIGNGNTMHVHVHREKKEKPMSTEKTLKRTCDGCGATQTWVDNQEHPTTRWYTVSVDLGARRIGGQGRGFSAIGFDACSGPCVSKALAKMPVPELPVEPETARPS